jgi:hypothetical protein
MRFLVNCKNSVGIYEIADDPKVTLRQPIFLIIVFVRRKEFARCKGRALVMTRGY